jgi:hypothetical protein
VRLRPAGRYTLLEIAVERASGNLAARVRSLRIAGVKFDIAGNIVHTEIKKYLDQA